MTETWSAGRLTETVGAQLASIHVGLHMWRHNADVRGLRSARVAAWNLWRLLWLPKLPTNFNDAHALTSRDLMLRSAFAWMAPGERDASIGWELFTGQLRRLRDVCTGEPTALEVAEAELLLRTLKEALFKRSLY